MDRRPWLHGSNCPLIPWRSCEHRVRLKQVAGSVTESRIPVEGSRCNGMGASRKALRRWRAFFLCVGLVAGASGKVAVQAAGEPVPMTVEEAAQLGEEFGVVVGEVDEEIQKELKLYRPQGVAVFEV